MNVLIAGLFACGCVSLVDAPLWPPASDYINSAMGCSQSSDATGCESTRKDWTGNFNAAIGGTYQAQMTVAHCLSTGCSGAIKTDPMLGCAWQKVAIDTASHAGADGKAGELSQYCRRPYLDEAGQRAAETEAKTLQQMLSVK
jgi:hypothetical protein